MYLYMWDFCCAFVLDFPKNVARTVRNEYEIFM